MRRRHHPGRLTARVVLRLAALNSAQLSRLE